ncbi:hypothetical protein ASPACDRAFT_117827 [Aspergillus aculeatus ATCC 16872]|uniref:Uncharacterized protein n=1 Tax=Aspergillus aculeatus (strain ATCC 16872 / CBS 172.66 / WB 5094) TaxID=690307 RepID=A0A1L9WY21_ASPA1|nr:uncharacterized protein ASPACDRAFT_117827 [Aspergillus aculeatus ATCC 16872]OJK01064.1 hypothetical protein ASPACDRAFT_117827 [Aspergillus aculeatus ATCC 16872]
MPTVGPNCTASLSFLTPTKASQPSPSQATYLGSLVWLLQQEEGEWGGSTCSSLSHIFVLLNPLPSATSSWRSKGSPAGLKAELWGGGEEEAAEEGT